jgi:ATP-dependent protease ClpP protease subunit
MKAALVAILTLLAIPAFAAEPAPTQPPPFVPNDAPAAPTQPAEAAPAPDMDSILRSLLGDDDDKKGPVIECKEHPCIPSYRFSDSVDEDATKKFEKFMTAATAAKADMVLLEINTPGGSMDDGHEMVRVIEHSPIQVVCIVDGKAASMGMYIFQSCDQRVMTKRSMLMVHQVSLMTGRGVRLTETSLENASATIKVATRAYVEWVTHRMKIKAPAVLQKINSGREWWLDWEEAIRSGAADTVVDGPPEAVLKNLKTHGTP